MNFKNLSLMVAASSVIALSGAAFAADQEKSSKEADTKAEQSQKPAKKKMQPHNHQRESKGMMMPDKPEEKAKEQQPGEGKMRPHEHMRDAK